MTCSVSRIQGDANPTMALLEQTPQQIFPHWPGGFWRSGMTSSPQMGPDLAWQFFVWENVGGWWNMIIHSPLISSNTNRYCTLFLQSPFGGRLEMIDNWSSPPKEIDAWNDHGPKSLVSEIAPKTSLSRHTSAESRDHFQFRPASILFIGESFYVMNWLGFFLPYPNLVNQKFSEGNFSFSTADMKQQLLGEGWWPATNGMWWFQLNRSNHIVTI